VVILFLLMETGVFIAVLLRLPQIQLPILLTDESQIIVEPFIMVELLITKMAIIL